MNDFWLDFPAAQEWYKKILQNFSFSQSEDEKARDFLYSMRKKFNPKTLIDEIIRNLSNKQPVFFGAGPNLWRQLSQISKGLIKHRKNFYLVAADGSANALKLFNLWPDLIVSDLDGVLYEDMVSILKHGTIALIHGHGDNLKQITLFSSLLMIHSRIICTTQTPPKYPIINPGGFTDGDRGLFFLHHLCDLKKTFWLFGYEFKESVGPFSKPGVAVSQSMKDIKRKKIEILKDLLLFLQKECHRSIIFYGNNPLIDLKIKFRINHATKPSL